MKKKFLLSIFILLISFLQNSCGSKKISKKITVASSGKIESLDPARANTLKAIQLISSLGDTLYELNSNGELKGKITDPDISINFNIDYPHFKGIRIREIWEGDIKNEKNQFLLNMKIDILQSLHFLQLSLIRILK